jgi:hypothetical protein
VQNASWGESGASVGPCPLYLESCGVKGTTPTPMQYERLLLRQHIYLHVCGFTSCCHIAVILLLRDEYRSYCQTIAESLVRLSIFHCLSGAVFHYFIHVAYSISFYLFLLDDSLLQHRATSYDAWLNVPNHAEPVVYLRPKETSDESSPTTTTCCKLPTIVQDHCMFALTGYNPMGQDRDLESNQKANIELKRELQQLTNPKPQHILDSFGFAQDWREDGFVVAYKKTDEQAGQAAIIDLAKKYKQGAIYGFTTVMQDGEAVSLLRKTIPAAMSDVEADVLVVACKKPTGIKNADVALT